MTISSTTTSVSYTGNNSTTAFPVTFAFFGTTTTSELEVIERTIATGAEATLVNVTNYTVAGGLGTTGTVNAVVAPADTVEWHIRRTTTQTQETDYVENDAFPADTHEQALDRLTMQNQEQEGELAKRFKLPDTDTSGADITWPTPAALKTVRWNAAGTALEEADDPNVAADAAAVSAAAALVSENNAAADAAQTALDVIQTNADVVSLTGTASTTSLLIEVASKAFTVTADLGFQVGDFVLATSDADEANYMHGQITGYASTTMTVNVTNIGGAGTLADWTIRRSGTEGPTGATGPTGPAGAGGGLFRGNNGTVGSSSGDIFRVNAALLTADEEIEAGENASATGPVTVDTGVTLTVSGTLVIL
ncbi:hypothetical protein N9937_02120 [bacterium]|nr:hypothetical protein [bacterium]